MRRLLLAVVLALSASMPARSQVPVTVGGFTFTDVSYTSRCLYCGTQIEFLVRSFIYPGNSVLLGGLQFEHSIGGEGFYGTVTFHGGAHLVGAFVPTFGNWFGEFDVGGTAGTSNGSVYADFWDPPLVGCNLPPTGTFNGQPTWRHSTADADASWYANVCGPDQYLDVVMNIPHVLFANGVDVTSTPEPASIALLATGLLAVAGIARRRRAADIA